MSKNATPDKSGASLVSFFVYNSSLCRREGEEHKKVLYYYPPDTDIDRKIKDVGLCEAVSKFTETFAPDTPVEALHTQKRRQLLHQPESQYWMVLTVGVPCSKRPTTPNNIEETSDALAAQGIEYQEDDVSDKVLSAVLHHSYKMFKLFMGSFAHIVSTSQSGVTTLSNRLEHFFSRYLLNLRIQSADLLDVFGGIHFLPLDKTTFLRIQCFVNAVEERFPAVKYTAFLYNDLLVWSSLAQVDIRILYSYLIKSLLPSAHLEHELGTALTHPQSPTLSSNTPSPTIHYPVSPSQNSSTTTRSYGSFITGPTSAGNAPSRVPKVFINTSTPNEECHLVVYRSLSATLCLLTEAGYPLSKQFYTDLEAYLGRDMARLASDVGEQYTKSVALQSSGANDGSQPNNWKYLYFNHMNLAQKTSLHGGVRGGGVGAPAGTGSWGGWNWSNEAKDACGQAPSSTPAVAEILGVLADMNADLSVGGDDGETIVKTLRDQWVVGKKSDKREVYVVIQQKNANLIEINEQLKNICNTHFTNIFFLD